MGEVDGRAEAVAALRRANPRASLGAITQYVDALMDYRRAQANIAEHGTIVAHPRTGAPLENPYVRVRATAAAAMAKVKLRNTDDVWEK